MMHGEDGVPFGELLMTIREGDEHLPGDESSGTLRLGRKWMKAKLSKIEKKRGGGRVYQVRFTLEVRDAAELRCLIV